MKAVKLKESGDPALILENAVEDSEALRAVPLPNIVLRPAVKAIGEVILDSTLETVHATFDSPQGEEAVREGAGAVCYTMPGTAAWVIGTLLPPEHLKVVQGMIADFISLRSSS